MEVFKREFTKVETKDSLDTSISKRANFVKTEKYQAAFLLTCQL